MVIDSVFLAWLRSNKFGRSCHVGWVVNCDLFIYCAETIVCLLRKSYFTYSLILVYSLVQSLCIHKQTASHLSFFNPFTIYVCPAGCCGRYTVQLLWAVPSRFADYHSRLFVTLAAAPWCSWLLLSFRCSVLCQLAFVTLAFTLRYSSSFPIHYSSNQSSPVILERSPRRTKTLFVG